MLRLDDKLGPILWQFGPNWALDLERFEVFLELLPRTTTQAARLAKRHDQRLDGVAWTRTDVDRPIRYAIEPRHPSFFTAPFTRLLRRHRVALVFADTADTFPYAEDLTADFIYVRLHGTDQIYAGGYGDEKIVWWAQRVNAWRCGGEPADARRIVDRPASRASRRDVYVYFDNDAKVRAPFDALRLARQLELEPGCEADPRHEDAGQAVAAATSALSAKELSARELESAQRWKRR